jgi:hypothetical protein
LKPKWYGLKSLTLISTVFCLNETRFQRLKSLPNLSTVGLGSAAFQTKNYSKSLKSLLWTDCKSKNAFIFILVINFCYSSSHHQTAKFNKQLKFKVYFDQSTVTSKVVIECYQVLATHHSSIASSFSWTRKNRFISIKFAPIGHVLQELQVGYIELDIWKVHILWAMELKAAFLLHCGWKESAVMYLSIYIKNQFVNISFHHYIQKRNSSGFLLFQTWLESLGVVNSAMLMFRRFLLPSDCKDIVDIP